MTKPKAPGKSHRKGITLLDLARMFPDEQAAVAWFEQLVVERPPLLRSLREPRDAARP